MSISGDTVAMWNASGRNALYVTNQSGNLALTINPGTNFGDNLSFGTTNVIGSVGLGYAFDDGADKWNRLRTTESGSVGSASGTNFRLLTASIIQDPHDPNKTVSTTEMSGAGSALDINGLNTAAIVFGLQPQSQRLDNIATMPQIYYGTDDIVGHRLLVDATSVAHTIKTGGLLTISSSGGGVPLPGESDKGFAQQGIKLKVVESNGPVWVGSFHDSPDSGIGFPIMSGEIIDLPVHNADIVRLYAETSGARVAYMYFSNDLLGFP